MIRLCYLILILLFLEFRTELVSADQPTKDISAIIKSYADAFTTVRPEESQYITTQIYPKIGVQDRGFVYDFTKAKHYGKPIFSSVPLVAAGSNPKSTNFDDFSSSASVEESNESVEPKGPADHVIPFSEHENPKEPSTRPNYTAPGDWAKPPVDKHIPLDFVPTKLYAQVRGSHTVKHLPQEDAAKSAETSEEKENAARLKEVVKESKANTIYTEEGYEDAAYDHAGQIRDADFHEDYKRKLNEELNQKRVYPGKNKRLKTYKKHKPRKFKDNSRNDFAENYTSQSEVAEEARTSRQQAEPEHLRILKSAVNQPVIDPKIVVESGIIQLEKDLKSESYQVQRTSTEPYTYVTTTVPTIFEPPATESVFQSKMDLETTTMRRNVFTIRPRKPFVTIRPYHNKMKKTNSLSTSKNNDNYNAYSTSTYSYEPTTVNYGNLLWGYLLQNQTPAITYPPPYFEQQTVNPVIANPLAVATVNGHGPYLVVVTAPPDTLTPNPLESKNLESTIGYVDDYNLTNPILADSSSHRNPYIPINRKVNHVNYNSNPHSNYKNTDISSPVLYRRGEIKPREKNPKLVKSKLQQPLSEVNPNYIERDIKYYTEMQPPKTSNAPIMYSYYQRKPYANAVDQWPETDESEKPVESDGSDGIERPPIEAEAQKNTLPVTKLLPPAPLSASEYATFHRQSKGIKPMPPNVIAMMPIIDAIHQHERNSLPFLFRRKRSTFGFFRSPNFKPIDKRHQGIDSTENLNQSSSKTNNTKFPANFHPLLNESPQVAAKVVDDEIKERFENGTKTHSDVSQSSKENSSDESSKTLLNSKENLKKGKPVEVEVPELDFSSVFEKDETEPTTEKPHVNTKKYPFYKDSSVLRNTALKYVVNPKEVPKKTLGGMEFYDSRIRECEEVDPNLEKIIPEDEEIANKRGPQKKKLRLRGLGDKIDCYKAKYFDDNPLDNPLFIEKNVDIPSPPVELNPKKFAARILQLPVEKDDYAIPKGPKNPEFVQRRVKLRRPLRQHISEQNVRYQLYPKLRKPNLVNTKQQRYRYQTKYPTSIEDKIRPHEARSKVKIKATNLKIVPRYQRLVYEDVMGNIMNLEKFQKSHVPKRGVIPVHSKYYNNDREQEITKKLKRVTIDGLVPPPQKISGKSIYANSNLKYDKNRHNSTDVLTKNLRIYKRSITLSDNQNTSETDDNVNKTDKPTFRIVLTTPPSRQISSKNQTLNTEEVSESAAQNTTHAISDSSRHSNRSEADPGRYDKFSRHKNVNSSVETRRKEPKYNAVKKSSSPDEILKFSRDTAFASSTFLPVMINLYDNFTARIPRGNRNNQAKQQVAEKPVYNKLTDKPKVLDDNIDHSIEQEDPKKQFILFEPVRHKDKNKTNEVVVTKYASTPIPPEHEELFEFLKGNPPGYEEAFSEEVDPEYTEDKSKEPLKKEGEKPNIKEPTKNEEIQIETLETQESPKNEETEDEISASEDPEPDERKKEAYGEESTSDDSPEEVEENVQPDGDGEKNPNDDAQDDEPFVRFSARPYSPPENYEDERYADLGPRINKPSFYHPPFDIPAYEKYALGKPVENSGDDYGHEETEDHEKYVFPWEQDDEDEEKKEESEQHSVLGRHEYPWEKRERQEREGQKREKMHKKNKKYFSNPNYDDDDDDYSKEASSTKFVYIPSKDKHLRGKKDVNAAQSNTENYTSKFSSKYKSAKTKDLEKNHKNSDDIRKSILAYIENIKSSTPKVKKVYISSRKNITDIVDENVTPDTLNKNNDTSVMNDNTQNPSTTISSIKLEKADRIISTTASSVSRNRGRSRRINMNIGKQNETTPSNVTHISTVAPVLSFKINRQRGRNKGSATILTTSTTAKPTIRRRTRLTSTTTTTRTIPRAVNERRRRPFRITSYTDSSTTTPSTLPTSTGRTVEREHRSRVSKEMIITKTVEDNDDDDPDEDSEKNTSGQDNKKSPSKVEEIRHSKIRHQQQTKTTPDDENSSKKERVEKVTITMEETPDHVYKTKEIDKDGIKGKFITITANNNSVKAAPAKRNRDNTAGVDDAEMEEMERRMEAFKSFDSVIQDTEDLTDEPSSLRAAEKYVVGSLLQKLPLPSSRKLTGEKYNNTAKSSNYENEDEDEDQGEDDFDVDDDDEETDDSDDEDADSEDSSDRKSDGKTYQNNNTNSTEKNPTVIKNPDNRKYYYVENR